LDNKVSDIIDARCNHEVPLLSLRSPLLVHVLNSAIPFHTILFQLTAMNHPWTKQNTFRKEYHPVGCLLL